MISRRHAELGRFYTLLEKLTRQSPARILGSATGRDGWPNRGVYFLFEPGELRSNGQRRVVRVGTHALIAGSKSSLWGRLAQHRGSLKPLGGNHRGSIFRTLVGNALMAKDNFTVRSWEGERPEESGEADQESKLECAVSAQIGAMSVVFLDIDDAPGKMSARGFIERNSIALLSNFGKEPIDAPNSNWLGLNSSRERVRRSGLWNNNHVDEAYDADFLDVMEQLLEKEDMAHQPREPRTDQSVFVIQCAKSKTHDGYMVDDLGRQVSFVSRPEDAPSEPGMCFARPDDVADDGQTWRAHLLAYNRRYTETGDNPLGLHCAAKLYASPTYGQLHAALPADRLFILSAAWGMVRSDFLLPNYDVSFSIAQNVPSHCRRKKGEHWRDFNMLDLMSEAPIIFIGGVSYLAPFNEMTQYWQGARIAYFSSETAPHFDGIEMRFYETDAKTNWHYRLVETLLHGDGEGASTKMWRQSRPLFFPQKASKADVPVAAPRSKSYGKYTPLFDHLNSTPTGLQSITMSFLQIENVLGARLPASARTHAQVWWANGGHPQSSTWLDAGFRKMGLRLGANDAESWVRFERSP